MSLSRHPGHFQEIPALLDQGALRYKEGAMGRCSVWSKGELLKDHPRLASATSPEIPTAATAFSPSRATMHSSVAVVAVLLITSPFIHFQAEAHADPSLCCFTYAKRQVPRKLLVSFEYANSMCPKPAIIFITKENRRICADPQADWAKSYIEFLQNKRN
ncbi:C-C motif chemokine 3 [Pogona vitticeps]